MTSEFDSPKENYFFPPDYVGEETMASDRQKNTLTNLIVEWIQNEDERERWFAQLNSMTSADCEEAIFSFLTAQMVIK